MRQSLRIGEKVTLKIDWPVLLADRLNLILVVKGMVIGSAPDTVHISLDKYEFRTAGKI